MTIQTLLRRPDGQSVDPSKVRYIKLGEGGSRSADCLKNGEIYIGFWTYYPEVLQSVQSKNRDKFRSLMLNFGKNPRSINRHFNEINLMISDIGDILWITIENQRLYWGFIDQNTFETRSEWGVVRKIHNGWSYVDLNGGELLVRSLAGAFSQVQGYRGTSCSVREGKYIVRRISGLTDPEVEAAQAAMENLIQKIEKLIGRLHHRDFEILIDLIFSYSGWRRKGGLGGTQKYIDIDLESPILNEKVFVQAKMKTNQREFNAYVDGIIDSPYNKMFYAFCHGKIEPSGSDVVLLDGRKIAELCVQAGLQQWIVDKILW